MAVRYIDVTEFREAGFLQEVNRRLLHPAGLALEVNTGWDRPTLIHFLRERGVTLNLGEEDKVWAFVAALGLDKEHLSGVWDDRDDPEGILYGDDIIDPEKAARVDAEIARHAPVREERFGYVVQPVVP